MIMTVCAQHQVSLPPPTPTVKQRNTETDNQVIKNNAHLFRRFLDEAGKQWFGDGVERKQMSRTHHMTPPNDESAQTEHLQFI